MNYEQIARKIADDTIRYIERHRENMFGAANVAARSITLLAEASIEDGGDTALEWQKELLDRVLKATVVTVLEDE